MTLNFNNVAKPVFDRLTEEIAKALPGTKAPGPAPDGTLRGKASHEDIGIEYVWNPTSNVLVMDVTKPFFVPFGPIQEQLTKIVDEARAAVLFGR